MKVAEFYNIEKGEHHKKRLSSEDEGEGGG